MKFFGFVFITCLLQNQIGFNAASCFTNNSFDNALPKTLKTFSRTDAIGPLLTIIHQMYVLMVRNVGPLSEEMCNTKILAFGKYEIKVSLHPRGCCSYCCKVDKAEDFMHLYFTNTKKRKTFNIPCDKTPGKLKSIGFNKHFPTIIFIPGFAEHGNSYNSLLIRQAYSSRNESYNIITVDWGDYTPLPWYVEAIDNTKFVGDALAKYIMFYNATGEMPIENIHLIGFSLGCHICGYIGKEIGKIQKIKRITALDPALPLMSDTDISQRISTNDAEYVDVIHTDPGKLGFLTSIGHADFYPNYDKQYQPGCRLTDLTKSKTLELIVSCEHLRAVQLYAESVKNPEAFPAVKLKSLNMTNVRRTRFIANSYMGFSAQKYNSQGDYFLSTNNHEPYGRSIKEQASYMKMRNKNFKNLCVKLYPVST